MTRPKLVFLAVLLTCVTLSGRMEGQVPSPDRPNCIDARVFAFPVSGRPTIRPEMMDMGNCNCDFWAFGCWFDCVFAQGGGGTGSGGGTGGGTDLCARCKASADRAFNACLHEAAIVSVNAMAYHDAFVECQEKQRNAYVDCNVPEGGPCNDV